MFWDELQEDEKQMLKTRRRSNRRDIFRDETVQDQPVLRMKVNYDDAAPMTAGDIAKYTGESGYAAVKAARRKADKFYYSDGKAAA